MKRISIITFSLLFSLILNAQNETDALRYSQIFPAGSARFAGLAGAFGAVGADFSTLSFNPAGIGMYRTSELVFTPSLYSGKTESEYNGIFRDDYKFNFNFGNIGFVYTFYSKSRFSEDQEGWKNAQFGFGVNRLNNFNNMMHVEGPNTENSLLDEYLFFANGNKYDRLDPFSTELAFNTYLLDTIGGSSSYFSAVPDGGVNQRKIVSTSGSLNEMVLSVGGNYSDRLYIGATLGFPFINYKETADYRESDDGDSIQGIDYYKVYNEFSTIGSGINFKFGLIFRATDWFRIGGAVHTPTYYFSMQDDYFTTMKSYWDDGNYFSDRSPSGRFEYKLVTPMRAIGSAAFLFGKAGLVSVDYEFVDYSTARLRSDWDGGDAFVDQNQNIRENYQTASNIRLGTEWRFNPFSIRGGYAIYGSPYKSGINDGKGTSITFGFGFRQKNYFVDLAYVVNKKEEDYYLYSANVVNPAMNQYNENSILLTLGFKY